MDKITERLAAARLVPVVKIENVEDALPLAQALTEGGCLLPKSPSAPLPPRRP